MGSLQQLISEAGLNLEGLKEVGRTQTLKFRAGNTEAEVQDRG